MIDGSQPQETVNNMKEWEKVRTRNGWSTDAGRLGLFVATTALTLSLIGCGGGGGDGSGVDPTEQNQGSLILPTIPEESLRIIPDTEAYAFNRESPYADILNSCALADNNFLCSVGTLPYIGSSTTSPGIEDIMDRVLVTHDWMGVRFRQLLTVMPADMLIMFRPVTSVIIGSEVRPASMNWYKGLMSLDPGYLWSTDAEKSTVSEVEDYRSNFGAELKFIGRWRMMDGDEYAFNSSQRDLEGLEGPLAMLLYHELAHANDRVRAERLTSLLSTQTPRDVVESSEDDEVLAFELYDDQSLSVQTSYLYGFANVRYRDETPSDFQKAADADFVGSVMAGEGKTQFYGYATIFEDVATLFAATMMKFHYGYDLHTAFINKPENYPDEYSCDELIVSWGSRNRIAAPLVTPRARWVTEEIVGRSSALDNFFANRLGQEIPLRVGDNWCESRVLNPAAAASNRSKPMLTDAEILQTEAMYFRDHHAVR